MHKQILLVTAFLAATTFSLEAKPKKAAPKDAGYVATCCTAAKKCVAKVNECNEQVQYCVANHCAECDGMLCDAATTMKDAAADLRKAACGKKHTAKHENRSDDKSRVPSPENELNTKHYGEYNDAKTYHGRHKQASNQ